MKTYCTQNNGDCYTCGLSNYNRDCHNELLLSESELRVAALIKQAKSNKDIARELNITEGTIKAHLHSIYLKLNIKSRAELIIKDL